MARGARVRPPAARQAPCARESGAMDERADARAREDELLDEVEWVGWRAGQRGFAPGASLGALPGHARGRAATFARRLSPSCTPRHRARLVAAYAEGYVDDALNAA